MIPLTFHVKYAKAQQLADAINDAITQQEYLSGNPLPSINKISKEYGVSRDTAFKAFQELISRGVVQSAPTKGYYVSSASVKILLLLDTYSPYKYELHNALTAQLPLNYKIDLYFHQGCEERFNKIINDSVGRYNLYLVMNYLNDSYSTILDRLDHNKVMLLDFGEFSKEQFSYACQGFDGTLYDCMEEGLDLFKKYEEIVMVFPENSEHPRSCIPYFEKFCKEHNFKYNITETLEESHVKPSTALLIIQHSDMLKAVKCARNKGLTLGKDVGVVVYNDEPAFEIIDNGITAISTDFRQIGSQAAKFILKREKIQTYIPTKLIIRNSL